MCVFLYLISVTVISVMTWLCIYCAGLAYDVFLRQMIDNKVDTHLKEFIYPCSDGQA